MLTDLPNVKIPSKRQVSHWLRRPVLKIIALIFLTVLVSSAVHQARGATQACKDIDNVTLCFDAQDDISALFGSETVIRYSGNVTIARKGQAPFVKIVATTQALGSHILHVADGVLDNPTQRFPFAIYGALQMLNEPNAQPIISTFKTDFPNCGGQFGLIEGKFKLNTVDATITTPIADDIVNDGDLDQCAGVQQISNAFRFNYLDRNGITQLFEANETNSVNLSGGQYKFDLTARKFSSLFTFNVKLNDSAENPNLQITLQSEINEQGKLTGSISSFKVKIAGLLMSATGVTLQPGVAPAPATFKAASVKVLKVDNPNQPSFNPADATLIFEFTNLKYNQGKWEIEGAEVGMPNLNFGSALTLENNRLGILLETVNGQSIQSIQIKSTMIFGKEGNGIPITLRVGRTQDGNGQFKPVFQAGLQDQTIKLGVMTFKLKNTTFVGNEAENFWGIKATSADLQWPANMGGQTAAGIADFKLGVNKDLKMQFGLGNGTIGLPPFENQVFRGTLQATIGVVAETMTITGTGSFTLKLAGNANSAGIAVSAIIRHNRNISTAPAQVLRASQVAAQMQAAGLDASRICFGPGNVIVPCPNDPPPTTPPGPKAFELKLAGFNFKLAGFAVNVVNPRSTDDGGFSADSASLSLPSGLNTNGGNASGLQVQGLVVKGNGDVTITGGGFELPTLKIGDFQIVKLIGNFKKEPNGNYAFTGGARFPMPGIEPGTGASGIGVEVTIRVQASGGFGGAGIKVDVTLPAGAGIPIGNTGMLLTRMLGQFDLNNGTVTFAVGVGTATAFQIPLGPLGSLPLARVDGGVSVQFNPFLFTANAELTVLIFNMANAVINVGDGQGFDSRSGLNVTVQVVRPITSGEFRMRYGKGTATDPNKRRFAAAANWTFGIRKGHYAVAIPPFDLVGVEVDLHGGIFIDKNDNPSSETIGIRGTACIANGNICGGLFINLRQPITSRDFLDFTGLDKYQLIPAAAIRAAAANGEAGFSSRQLSVAEAEQMGLVLAASQLSGVDGIFAETVDIPVTQTTTLLAGIDYFSGAPLVRLQLPDGTILSEGSVNSISQFVLTDTASITKSIYFVVKNTTPGTYKLMIDNIVEYQKVSYTINEAPKLSIGDVVCPGSRPTPVTATCNIVMNQQVIASDLAAIDGSSATITWTGSDIDSPNATVDIGYIKDSGDKNNIDYAAINIVAEDLPLAAGEHAIDFKERGAGNYRFVVIADDGVNGGVMQASNTVVSVIDNLPPAVPQNLEAVSQGGELLIKWTQNSEADLVGYEIGFGLVNDSNQFVYTRTMGPKEVITGTNNIVDAKLWGLDDNVTVFYGLRAYDTSGNYSDWMPLQSATPWALSPNAWSPAPNGFGEQDVVEIAFAVPMNFDSLQDKLVVKDGTGSAVAGTTYYLSDSEGRAIGIGLELSTPISGTTSATLTGGEAGVKAADGRAMGGNFSWNFRLSAPPVVNPPGGSVFLPIVLR